MKVKMLVDGENLYLGKFKADEERLITEKEGKLLISRELAVEVKKGVKKNGRE